MRIWQAALELMMKVKGVEHVDDASERDVENQEEENKEDFVSPFVQP